MNAVLGKIAVWKLQRAEPCVSCLSKTAVREPKAVETRQRAFGEHDNRFLVHSHIWLLPLNPDRFSYLLRVKHGADRRPAMPAQETRSLLSLHHSPAAGKAYWREYRRGERVALPAPATMRFFLSIIAYKWIIHVIKTYKLLQVAIKSNMCCMSLYLQLSFSIFSIFFYLFLLCFNALNHLMKKLIVFRHVQPRVASVCCFQSKTREQQKGSH